MTAGRQERSRRAAPASAEAASQPIVIFRLSALGDVIHTIPAVLSLGEAGAVTWVVEAPYRELVEVVTGAKTVPVRIRRWLREPATAVASLRRLRGCEVAVDFQGLIKSAVLMRASGAKIRFGFDRHSIREPPAILFSNRRVAVDTTLHVVEQNMQLARAVRPDQPSRPGQWSAFAADPERRLSGLEGSVVLLPGAGKPNKLWPVERFRTLARQIGNRALAVWGPGERELAAAIGGRMAPPTNLRELAWLLRNAEVVIGADTGPLHLAAALGTRVIGLYGPTDPRRNGPFGQLDHTVDHFHLTKSMESISVEQVMKTLHRVVGA